MYEHLGTFAPVWGEWMKAYQPKVLARLRSSGQDEAAARAFQQKALLALDSTFGQLRRKNPAPKEYLAAVQHLQNLQAMAREQVLADLLPTPAPSEAEMSG